MFKDNKILWYRRFYFKLNHKSPYYFFEKMVKCHIKHPLFTLISSLRIAKEQMLMASI